MLIYPAIIFFFSNSSAVVNVFDFRTADVRFILLVFNLYKLVETVGSGWVGNNFSRIYIFQQHLKYCDFHSKRTLNYVYYSSQEILFSLRRYFMANVFYFEKGKNRGKILKHDCFCSLTFASHTEKHVKGMWESFI